MHTKLERLLSKSLTTMEVMAYDLVVHTGPERFSCLPLSLGGLVVSRPLQHLELTGIEPSLPAKNQTSDIGIGTSAVSLPSEWRFRVSAGTGWPGVGTLWLSETQSLIYKIVAQSGHRYCFLGRSSTGVHFAYCWDSKQLTNSKATTKRKKKEQTKKKKEAKKQREKQGTKERNKETRKKERKKETKETKIERNKQR